MHCSIAKVVRWRFSVLKTLISATAAAATFTEVEEDSTQRFGRRGFRERQGVGDAMGRLSQVPERARTTKDSN